MSLEQGSRNEPGVAATGRAVEQKAQFADYVLSREALFGAGSMDRIIAQTNRAFSQIDDPRVLRGKVIEQVLGKPGEVVGDAQGVYNSLRVNSTIPLLSTNEGETSVMDITAQVNHDLRKIASADSRIDGARPYRNGAIALVEAEMDIRARQELGVSREAREEQQAEMAADAPRAFSR